jgi:hypothetical protein
MVMGAIRLHALLYPTKTLAVKKNDESGAGDR